MNYTPAENLAITLTAVIIFVTIAVVLAFAALWAFVALTGAAVAVTLTNAIALLVIVAFIRFSLAGLFQSSDEAQKRMLVSIMSSVPKDAE